MKRNEIAFLLIIIFLLAGTFFYPGEAVSGGCSGCGNQLNAYIGGCYVGEKCTWEADSTFGCLFWDCTTYCPPGGGKCEQGHWECEQVWGFRDSETGECRAQ